MMKGFHLFCSHKMMEGFQTFCSHQNDGGSGTSLKKLASPSSVPLAPAPPRTGAPPFVTRLPPHFHHGLRRRTDGPLDTRGDQGFTTFGPFTSMSQIPRRSGFELSLNFHMVSMWKLRNFIISSFIICHP